MRMIPISSKAESILEKRMGGNPMVKIKTREGNKVLVVSLNGEFCVWVDLSRDRNWMLTLR